MDDAADREQLRTMLRYAAQATAWAREAGPAWTTDDKTVAAVAMVVGQIGESATRLGGATRARWPDLPWQRMRGMRNVLYHTYGAVDVAILAATVTDGLPDLVKRLEAILTEE